MIPVLYRRSLYQSLFWTVLLPMSPPTVAMEDKQPEAMVNDQQSAHLEDAKPDGTNATVCLATVLSLDTYEIIANERDD